MPYDEEQIDSADLIIRRINPQQHVFWDPNRKQNRISSKAYSKSSGLAAGMSVDVEALIIAQNVDPKQFVTTPIFTGSVAFPAGEVRKLGFWIGYEAIINVPGVPDNPYHGEVWMDTPKKNFSDAQKMGLAKLASWYVSIEGVDLT